MKKIIATFLASVILFTGTSAIKTEAYKENKNGDVKIVRPMYIKGVKDGTIDPGPF